MQNMPFLLLFSKQNEMQCGENFPLKLFILILKTDFHLAEIMPLTFLIAVIRYRSVDTFQKVSVKS